MAGLFFLLVILPWKTVYQRRLKHGLPLLEQRSLVPARLDFIDMIMTLVIYFGVQVVGIVVVAENPDPQDNTNHFLQLSPFNSAAGLSTLLTFFVAVPVIYFRRGDLRAMRLRFDRVTELVRIGFYASLLILPVTLVINIVVSIVVTPYGHPVIDTLLAETSVSTIVYTAITVVIAAPLVEEFVFRGVILTYLHRVFSGQWDSNTAVYCSNTANAHGDGENSDLFQLHGANILTSLLFAALHIGQGAAYIPLFFLSFALGYVCNKTGSILPCVIIHMVLNGISTVSLYFMILYQS
tara:strand:+ start:483 stop:1367 length:885 start_codon:yes stop_codon:yes gene_type:complete